MIPFRIDLIGPFSIKDGQDSLTADIDFNDQFKHKQHEYPNKHQFKNINL